MTRNFPPFTMLNTEVRRLQSTYVAQEYKLFIQLPEDYATSGKTYPVLYVSDANWVFPSVAQVASRLHLDTDIQTPIVVGIGYPTDDFDTQLGLRVRDFTPTRDPEREERRQRELGVPYTTGGADNFLRFIQQELFPFIEAEYRADPACRTYVGYSYGGLFGMHALLSAPEAFQRHVLCSPSLGWGNEAVFATERAYAEQRRDLPVRLYMCIGSLEQPDPDPANSILYRMTELLKSRAYTGLTVNYTVFEDEPHSTIVSASIARSLRWLDAPSTNA